MKHPERSREDLLHTLYLLFTCDDVVWLKHALFALEVLIAAKPQSLPKRQFALETVT